MDAKEFNELKNLYKCNKNATDRLQLHCLQVIKKRLLFRNGLKDLENLAHSILEKFISNLPDHYIVAPISYLNRCTDNYLSTLKSKNERETALTSDISYEQRFEALEKFEFFCELEEHLGKLDAILIYSHCVEKIPELQLAKELKMPYTAVRQRICRAKKKLKTIFSQNVT